METKPVNLALARPGEPEPVRQSPHLTEFAHDVVTALRSTDRRRLAIDGMWGFPWDELERALAEAAARSGLKLVAHSTLSALRPAGELGAAFQEWLTDNPTFGRVCEEPIDVYFDSARMAETADWFRSAAGGEQLGGSRVTPDQGCGDPGGGGESGGDQTGRPAGRQDAVVAVIGPGALHIASGTGDSRPGGFASASEAVLAVYCDLPREEIILKQDREGLGNFGFGSAPPHSKYKAAYYIEWPILERHKLSVWSRVELYCSLSDGAFAWTSRRRLEALVGDVSKRPFRCKPMFMPGVWGGQRLLEAADVGRPMPNCAWDFEIVAPENAITLGDGDAAITIGFHLFMHLESEAILGPEPSRCFGSYFPIRFNYLDTMGGSNLSCQVHPHAGYIRERFNEPMAQHESYYIVECKPGAKVYLGFRDATTRESFKAAVTRAEKEKIPFDIDDYVKGWPSEEGGYFLIPAGTVHCSGKDNLVLEISATPYWYTFKIYDYLRPDLNGEPRPINSAYAFDVLDFSRKEAWVERKLIAKPRLLRREEGGEEYFLASMEEIFYAVNRLHVRTSLSDETGGRFHILTVVKGESATIVSESDPSVRIDMNYLETYVVPACFGAYRIEAGREPCQVVKAYVKL